MGERVGAWSAAQAPLYREVGEGARKALRWPRGGACAGASPEEGVPPPTPPRPFLALVTKALVFPRGFA